MPAHDEPPTIAERLELLRVVPLLATLGSSELSDLAGDLRVVEVAAGEWLCREGDPADTAYVVSSGRLEVTRGLPEPQVIRTLRRGAAVGELALLRRGPRTASVRATRDSVLFALARGRFEQLILNAPNFALSLARAMADQLAATTAAETPSVTPRTLTLVALDDRVDLSLAAQMLVSELDRGTSVAIIDRPAGEQRADWTVALARAEISHDFVVLAVAATEPGDPWATFCLGECDLAIALSGRAIDPRWTRAVGAIALSGSELVAIDYRVGDDVIGTIAPRQVRAVRGRMGLAAAMREIGRRVTGRGVGLVLSGGGARALAHIGVIEGLRDAGITFDRIGGVSQGSIISAGLARGDSPEQVYELARYFCDTNPTNDYTLPLAAVIRGRKFERLLDEVLGDTLIEELPTPYFCTSTDVVNREIVVHRTGRLADAVRASMSVPGLLPPVRDRSGRVLVDGGVLDNLPIATMAAMGGGPIIAADVTTADDDPAAATDGRRWARAPAQVRRLITGTDAVLPSLGETIIRCVTLASSDTVAASRQHADLVISPEVSGIGLLDWQRLPEMRTAGIAAVTEALAGAGEIVDRIRTMSA